MLPSSATRCDALLVAVLLSGGPLAGDLRSSPQGGGIRTLRLFRPIRYRPWWSRHHRLLLTLVVTPTPTGFQRQRPHLPVSCITFCSSASSTGPSATSSLRRGRQRVTGRPPGCWSSTSAIRRLRIITAREGGCWAMRPTGADAGSSTAPSTRRTRAGATPAAPGAGPGPAGGPPGGRRAIGIPTAHLRHDPSGIRPSIRPRGENPARHVDLRARTRIGSWRRTHGRSPYEVELHKRFAFPVPRWSSRLCLSVAVRSHRGGPRGPLEP